MHENINVFHGREGGRLSDQRHYFTKYSRFVLENSPVGPAFCRSLMSRRFRLLSVGVFAVFHRGDIHKRFSSSIS